MDFRLASPEDRGLVESLWDYCFEHREDPFFQWYFNHFYQPENVLMGFQDDEMACLTHLNPYTLSLRGKAIDTSYIVGLATHPAARRGGIGGKLLTAALAEMKRRGHYVNILMPSKAGFYQPYGYELYCHQWKETLPLEALRPLTDRTVRYAFVNSSDQWPYLAAVYDGYTKGLSGYALRDEKVGAAISTLNWEKAILLSVSMAIRLLDMPFTNWDNRRLSVVNLFTPLVKARPAFSAICITIVLKAKPFSGTKAFMTSPIASIPMENQATKRCPS